MALYNGHGTLPYGPASSFKCIQHRGRPVPGSCSCIWMVAPKPSRFLPWITLALHRSTHANIPLSTIQNQ
ncbi:hypothetical protein G7K_3612-t1 [Saitoella complicata NRRL Y-17804]|uniref:Uncharacterized protein n=1 Tax=Saitoella complicata (strain BCRC 22490 / CBS 7301 / JCM 7358 / NBRC 10748 / NRRL Y-17804) TaxID=698492 RepID=A0A0E9NHX0_SAICN|nr:hypothetical protein G7K_3612-t1 [Saitoella complicata NRRL Y-17804]